MYAVLMAATVKPMPAALPLIVFQRTTKSVGARMNRRPPMKRTSLSASGVAAEANIGWSGPMVEYQSSGFSIDVSPVVAQKSALKSEKSPCGMMKLTRAACQEVRTYHARVSGVGYKSHTT